MASPCRHTEIRSMFDTPDRHTPPRSLTRQADCTFRTSLSPQDLSPRARYARQRDHTRDPFRSCSDFAPRQQVKHHVTVNSNHTPAPHHTPSFIDVRDTTDGIAARARLPNLRHASQGSIWSMGSRTAAIPIPTPTQGVDTGTGEVAASGTNAPLITAQFLSTNTEDKGARSHEARLALALDIDQASRVLPISPPMSPSILSSSSECNIHRRTDSLWSSDYSSAFRPQAQERCRKKPQKAVPSVAFRVLDAPRLKDDFYCSVLAYHYPSHTLATESHGVRYPPLPPARLANYVSSLAFSSSLSGKGILAIARNSGHVTLWSLFEQNARFEAPHPWAVCAVAFRPTTTTRQIAGIQASVACEDLLVGDDSGYIYYYSIHWPVLATGSMILLTKLDAHSQNICGLAWSPDGRTFVSGGNDNAALLFVVDDILKDLPSENAMSEDEAPSNSEITHRVVSGLLTPPTSPTRESSYGGSFHATQEVPTESSDQPMTFAIDLVTTPIQSPHQERQGRTRARSPWSEQRVRSISSSQTRRLRQNLENHLASPGVDGRPLMHKRSFHHSAAVKAIAYAPWQPTLLATGGGSNDRQIHFHHTESGTILAVINVSAQVTSLSWSRTSREIVATFGYAQPEHDVRIAVFAWPSCECVVSIPWERKANGEIGRALWAIPYPGGPNDSAPTRQAQEETDAGFQAWEAIQAREANRRFDRASTSSQEDPYADYLPEQGTRRNDPTGRTRTFRAARTEGEAWASRTQEAGSLIIACCDQTVKFFEIWAGKSKGCSKGIGAKASVLGGSKILEGWCEGVCVDEVDIGADIR